MTRVVTAQGAVKGVQQIYPGMITAFHGPAIPSGWLICDGTLGTPNMVDRFVLGDTAAGLGTTAGTISNTTGLAHTAFALTNHSNHTPTQPSGHSNHTPTQPTGHSNHTPTQPTAHGVHSTDGLHSHNAHTVAATGSAAVSGTKLTGPAGTHSAAAGHAHGLEDHSHTGFAVDAHSAHAGFAVDAHSAHAGFAVDAHSVHVVGQPSTHIYKAAVLVYIMKL